MAGRSDEPLEIGERKNDGRCVDVRMKCDRLGSLQVGIDHQPNRLTIVVNQAKRRDSARRDRQVLLKPFRRRKAQTFFAELPGQPLDINSLPVFGNDKVMNIPFLVAEEEVFAMRRGDARPMRGRFLHGVHGWVLVSVVGNPEPFKDVVDAPFFIDRHKGHAAGLSRSASA
jgi:hypothetical protein